jgi:protein TonB
MDRIQFIHPPRENPARNVRAILASCAFHALMLGALLGLTFYYQLHEPPPPSGSAAGAPTITLEAMVVVPTPPAPTPVLTPPTVEPPIPTVAKPLQEPISPEKLPDEGLPVLPMKPSKQTLAKTPEQEPHRPNTESSTKPAPAAMASSYAPGVNTLPHPPYPIEARNRGQTGTVVMFVRFDAQGNVEHAEVSVTSGVPELDSETKSFIREHWHSADYAGQTISQPVQYSLEDH